MSRPRRIYHFVAGFLSWFVFGSVSLVLNFVCAILLVLPGRARLGPMARETIRRLFGAWCAWLHATRLIFVTWTGFTPERLAGPAVYIANHPGLLDATYILARLPDTICIFKPSVIRNPALGPAAILAGYAAGDAGVDLIRDVAGRVADGRSLLIFPEGTRTLAGVPLNPLKPGFAVGALAAGADLMAAEALLAIGAELHIALPATIEAFRRDSVSGFGTDWDRRFDAVLDAAQSIDTLDTLDRVSQAGIFVSDEMAMGMAIRQASMLETGATALRIGDGERCQGRRLDAAWEKRGLPIHRVTVERAAHGAAHPLPIYAREAVITLTGHRDTDALAEAGARIERRGGSTIARFADPVTAAHAALAEVGKGDGKLGLAYGAFDPEDDGTDLIDTAIRIAGTAHPGRVPVTRSMALALTLEAPELRCENFGTIASSQGDIALSMLVPA